MEKTQRSHMTRKREMEAEWKSWEPHIRADLERLEHRIQCVYSSMSVFGVNKADREKYVQQKLNELIRTVAGGESA